MKLLLATTNPGKVREFHELLAGCPVELVVPADLGLKLEVEENGATYADNARLKAAAWARASGLMALADDSGLEVEALGGEPGTKSARYAGDGATDHERVRFLLEKLRHVPEDRRQAAFRCVIALTYPDGAGYLCEGRCEGLIVDQPRGAHGFGYDPIFLFPGLNRTMAELPSEVKNQVSHRGRAAAKARQILERLARAEVRDAGRP
jgi:XTP/dITP diphosphohydrolase